MKLPLRAYWTLLSRHIRPQRARFILLTFLLLGSIALQVVNPQFMRAFIDTALTPQVGGTSLLVFALAFIGIAIVQQVVSVGVTYLGESVAWTATNALRAELAWHCLNLDMSFHNQHTPGELIERIDGDITQMANFFSQFVITLLGNALLMFGILAALFREDWRSGLAFTAFTLLTVGVLASMRDIAVRHFKARRQAEADLSGFLEEQLSGSEDVRSNGAVEFSLREVLRLQRVIFGHDKKAHQKNFIVGEVVPGALLMIGTILSVALGYWLYTAGQITLGTVYLFIHYVNLLETPIWALSRQLENFQTIGACVERLTELRAQTSQVKDGSSAVITSGPLPLHFNEVNFAYADAPQDLVLRDLTFALAPGQVLGLLGRTGSGKTTLTRLIFRMFDPTSGSIRVDGADLRTHTLQALRQRVALVTQEVQLFRASLRDNLTFFDASIHDDQIYHALRELGLTDWLHSLPKGLDTEISSGARSLSAGEAQLLAFTRIFLRDPGLIILDEASSRLDPATEQRLEKALDRLLAGRTAIIIAHRLNTVHRADSILILDEGRICEQGQRTALASDPHSHFYSLLQTGLEEVLV